MIRRITVAGAALTVFAATLLTPVAANASTVTVPTSTSASTQVVAVSPRLLAYDRTMIALINKERAARRLPLLLEARGLDGVVAGWSRYMAQGGTGFTLVHNANGWSQVRTSGGGASNATMWAENIGFAAPSTQPASYLFNAYMRSPGHRANILNPGMRYIGLVSYANSRGEVWNTMNFTDRVVSGQAFHPTDRVAVKSLYAGRPLAGSVFSLRDATCKREISTIRIGASGAYVVTVNALYSMPTVYCVVTVTVPRGFREPLPKRFTAQADMRTSDLVFNVTR